MKLATIKKNSTHTFNSVINFFSLHFFGDSESGYNFFNEFGKYLDTTKFPTDEIVLDPFYGNYNEFAITFKYNNERIAWGKFEMNTDTKIINTNYMSFNDKTIEKMFSHIIKDFINDYNKKVFEQQLNKCNIQNIDTDLTIIIDKYTDYKINEQITIKGKIEEIFDKYVTYNDKMKYCNGDYWRFNDNNITTLYTMFKQKFNGNYFLHNALKRGVIID